MYRYGEDVDHMMVVSGGVHTDNSNIFSWDFEHLLIEEVLMPES